MENAFLYTILLILTPLAGFVINGLGFRQIPKSVAGTIGVSTCVAAFGFSVGLYTELTQVGPIHLTLYNWINAGTLNLNFSVLIDQLTIVMLLMVTGIGSLIHIYSASYMSHDEGYGKFFAYLNLFIFSMLLLVLGGNYLVMFVGWEGVGLCSYLLIGFWYKNVSYNNAARKAFIMNRIGDLGLLLGVFLIYNIFGTIEFTDVFAAAQSKLMVDSPPVIAITMLLFVGAMGKSAQIPLFTWLPDAMAGPTPVSALIHAATMVTAGVYMVFRSNALYALAPTTLEFVAAIGAATALLGALIGLAQNDIKKVLAYSTVSQLGYMFMALGVGAYQTSLFHVLMHAFFKALLFLGAGSVIHAMSNEQDIRNMGGLRAKLPVTFLTFLVGTLAISGIPPFAGFFSKDEILYQLYLHNKGIYAIGLFSSFLTAFYMFRLVYLTFAGSFRGTPEQGNHLHESPIAMTLPLMLLAVLSTVGGLLNLPAVFNGDSTFSAFLQPVLVSLPEPTSADHHSLESLLMLVSVCVAVAGIALATLMYQRRGALPVGDNVPLTPLHRLVSRKFYVDEIYDAIIVRPVVIISRILSIAVEYLIIDLVVHGVAKLFSGSGRGLRYAQSGSTGTYLLFMVCGIVLCLLFVFQDILL